MKAYSVYLQFGSGKLKIPVNPEEIEIKRSTDHKEYDVLGLGQIVVPRKPSLTEISWEGFFPANTSAPYVNSGAKRPEVYVDKLEKALKNKQKLRVIISGSERYDTNMRCIVDEFTTKDKGGEPGDVYYEITLREYRPYAPQTVQIITTPPAGQTSETAAEVTTEEPRAVETPVLRVGATVTANGKYWYDSYGSKPFGTANNLSTTVTRIVEGNPYPVHIGSYGWLQASQLQITG